MNAKTFAALVIVAAISGLSSRVQAQSPSVPISNTRQYTLSGDSLTGINNRTANEDFVNFFLQEKNVINQTGSNVRENTGDVVDPYLGVWQISDKVQLQRVDEPLSPTNTSPVILQPAQSINGNDGLQVQLGINE
ncbi:hypothetical protein ACF3DV_20005 [Chlorogloeopsis fritschii PCC 9212]|jgi:hypothetical protein|uniref:Filamentous haemagglutinin FhaB/tRNA nuclease CdiA-like TPS domain-containing protein n=1 Tax=Chlorogloeopsis fritschii PCC 6912 TaxID=211165 RepID=A0A433NN22_CHLFR|nr:hypothetical protein [Chlorogloeopsis fritschii]MBF2005414.1 hypothetical protein [Chlorogloeopsis fritschii C42_A2020_084]RUR84586.1 hypothetical protein PCC6912_14810 [Chlorogloeopsis fritschii PCC 6912]